MLIYFLFHKNLALLGKETQAKQLLEKRPFRCAHWGTRRKPVPVPKDPSLPGSLSAIICSVSDPPPDLDPDPPV